MTSNQNYAYDEDEASPYDRGTVAALFDTRDDAKYALRDLHEAGFHKTWMGVTRADESAYDASTVATGEHEVVTAEGGGIGASLARFFGEEGRESLYDALTKRGVPSSDALALDQRMHDGGAVVTVEAEDRYDEVLRILGVGGANVAADVRGLGSSSAAAEPLVGSATTSGTTASDATTGDGTVDRTIELREERLAVDKHVVSSGEATIGKRVVTQDASIDVPVMHEELFISRRRVDGTPAAGAIGSDETIRVPLMREKVVVDKRTVVREEVAIGKRAVAGTERIDDTVRHEELVVDGAATPRDAAVR